MNSFEPHGEFELNIDGSIMHMRAAGPTNFELIQRVGQKVDDFLDAHGGKACATLLELGDQAILTAEAMKKCDEILVIHKSRGLCAIALIVHAPDHRDFITSCLGRLYDAVGLSWHRFDRVEHAREWLEGEVEKANALSC